jgi:transcriptional regulator with XRE-family HTH domain
MIQKDYRLKLKELKEDGDLKNIDVAKVLHCSPKHYGNLETGKRAFSIEQIIKLANYYNVSLEYILEDTTDKTPIHQAYIFDYEIFLKQLILLRTHNNYTQAFIAQDILNISQSMYSRYEKNIHHVDLLTIIKLANFYNVSISYLLGLDEN